MPLHDKCSVQFPVVLRAKCHILGPHYSGELLPPEGTWSVPSDRVSFIREFSSRDSVSFRARSLRKKIARKRRKQNQKAKGLVTDRTGRLLGWNLLISKYDIIDLYELWDMKIIAPSHLSGHGYGVYHNTAVRVMERLL